MHGDVIEWKHFLRCWPSVKGIHWAPNPKSVDVTIMDGSDHGSRCTFLVIGLEFSCQNRSTLLCLFVSLGLPCREYGIYTPEPNNDVHGYDVHGLRFVVFCAYFAEYWPCYCGTVLDMKSVSCQHVMSQDECKQWPTSFISCLCVHSSKHGRTYVKYALDCVCNILWC